MSDDGDAAYDRYRCEVEPTHAALPRALTGDLRARMRGWVEPDPPAPPLPPAKHWLRVDEALMGEEEP